MYISSTSTYLWQAADAASYLLIFYRLPSGLVHNRFRGVQCIKKRSMHVGNPGCKCFQVVSIHLAC